MLKSKFWKMRKNQNGKVKNEELINKQKQSIKVGFKGFKNSQKQERNKIMYLLKQNQLDFQTNLDQQSSNLIIFNIYFPNKQKILLSLPASLPINYFHQIIPNLIMLHKKFNHSHSQIYQGIQIKSIFNDEDKEYNYKQKKQNQGQIIDFNEYIKNIELKTQRDRRWESYNKQIQRQKKEQEKVLIFNNMCCKVVKYLYQSVCITFDDGQLNQLGALADSSLFNDKQQKNPINIQIKYIKIDQNNTFQIPNNSKITSHRKSSRIISSKQQYHKKSLVLKKLNKSPTSISQQQQSLAYSQSLLISPSNFSQNKQLKLKSLFSNSNSKQKSKSKSGSIGHTNYLRSNKKYLELYSLDEKMGEMSKENEKLQSKENQFNDQYLQKHKQFYQSVINLCKNSTIIEWQVFYRMIVGFDQRSYQYYEQDKQKKFNLSKKFKSVNEIITIPLNIHDQSNKPINNNSKKNQAYSYDMICLSTNKKINSYNPSNNQPKVPNIVKNSSPTQKQQSLLYENLSSVLLINNQHTNNQQSLLLTHQVSKLYTYCYREQSSNSGSKQGSNKLITNNKINQSNSNSKKRQIIKQLDKQQQKQQRQIIEEIIRKKEKQSQSQQEQIEIKQRIMVVFKKVTKKGIRVDQYMRMILGWRKGDNCCEDYQQQQSDDNYMNKLQIHLVDMVKKVLIILHECINSQTMQCHYYNRHYSKQNYHSQYNQYLDKIPTVHSHKTSSKTINLFQFLLLFINKKITNDNNTRQKFGSILSMFVIDLDKEKKGEYNIKIDAIKMVQLLKILNQSKDLGDLLNKRQKQWQWQNQYKQNEKQQTYDQFIKIYQQLQQSLDKEVQQLSQIKNNSYKDQQNNHKRHTGLDNKHSKRKEKLFGELKQNLLKQIVSIVKGSSSRLSIKQKQLLCIGIQHQMKSMSYGNMFQYRLLGQLPFQNVFVRYLVQKTKRFLDGNQGFKAVQKVQQISKESKQKDDNYDYQQNSSRFFDQCHLNNRIKSILQKQLQTNQASLNQLRNQLNYNFFHKTIISSKTYQTPRYFHFQADQDITLHEKQTTLKKNKKNSHSSNRNNQLDLIQQRGLKINEFCLNNQGQKGEFITLNPNKGKEMPRKIKEKKKIKRNKVNKDNKENQCRNTSTNKQNYSQKQSKKRSNVLIQRQ